MRIFYDTEFLEDGRTIELISIGMVAENGDELYRINADAPWRDIERSDWLMKNVVPSLPFVPGKIGRLDMAHSDARNVAQRERICGDVLRFIREHAPAELWAWYGAYDHVALAQLFGRMIDLPEGIPMFTCDLKQEVEQKARRLNREIILPNQADGQHNALADARHVMAMALYLDGLK